MTIQVLNNSETLGTIRGKINANFAEHETTKVSASAVLIKTNTTPFTPTGDYHPVPKIYADNIGVSLISTYDPQGISGDAFVRSNHTGLLDPSVIDQDLNYRFVTDTQISDWNQKENDIGTKGTAFNKSFGTIAGSVSEGNHVHTKADIGLGNVDNTTDVGKPISTLQQAALDLKQDIADLEADIETIVQAGEVSFAKYRNTKAIVASYSILETDDSLIVAATAGDIILTLPSLASLVGKPYSVVEIIPVVANSYKIRILCAGSDTFPFGNTWFDLPFSQKQFAIGLHEHGFNLRRNISVKGLYTRSSSWNSSNFGSATGIPWETEEQNTQDELVEWEGVINPSRIYVRTTGSYTIKSGINLSPAAVQSWNVKAEIYKNGVAIGFSGLETGGEGNNNASIFGSMTFDLEADDYIEMRLTHSGTAAVNVTSAKLHLEIRL